MISKIIELIIRCMYPTVGINYVPTIPTLLYGTMPSSYRILRKALSIKQPWAWAILNYGKDIENRNWKTKVRGRILIHAGKEIDANGMLFMAKHHIDVPPDLETGGIVGSVEIVDCVRSSDSPWFFGKYGFVLENPTKLPFKPCRGQLSFFNVDYYDEEEPK